VAVLAEEGDFKTVELEAEEVVGRDEVESGFVVLVRVELEEVVDRGDVAGGVVG
jgi:hypothetical protein